MPAKDLLFQILRTPDLTQANIQHVDELLTAEPSLLSGGYGRWDFGVHTADVYTETGISVSG